MATIRYLSWNIQTYGPAKYNKNRAKRIDFIGNVILATEANLVAIMETAPSAADNILFSLSDWLYQQTRQDWNYVIPNVQADIRGGSQSYAFLWSNAEFDMLKEGQMSLYGWANYDVNGDVINMPTNSSGRGGRQPMYTTFRTRDTHQNFSVIVYHAPSDGRYASLGIERVAQSMMITEVPLDRDDVGGMRVAVDACLLSGDFNVDYIQYPGSYEHLTDNPPGLTSVLDESEIADAARRSSLKSGMDTLEDGTFPQNSLLYRANAYDDIYYRNVARVILADVIDVIEWMNTEEPDDEGDADAYVRLYWSNLARIARSFDFDQERSTTGLNIGEIGRNIAYNWWFYLKCISDHLPVYAEVVI